MEGLDKGSIQELKAYAKPPDNCILVAKAVITLFGVRLKEPWKAFQKLAANPADFIRNL